MKKESTLDLYEGLKGIKDPEQFELERKKIIDAEIEKVDDPDKKRMLNSVQFAIDNERRKFKDPIACAARLHALMLERGLLRLNDVYKGKLAKKENNVVSFAKRK